MTATATIMTKPAGRIIGVFHHTPDGSLHINVNGVIDAGPKARRSNSSFFQDGDYQTQIFRQLETAHPEIEHLGNWHTHHVNGYPTLSGGDINTYRRIVNHEKHNLDFFYALLVVAREPKRQNLARYRIRHYILFRGDQNVYEIAPPMLLSQRNLLFGRSNTKRRRRLRLRVTMRLYELETTESLPNYSLNFGPICQEEQIRFTGRGPMSSSTIQLPK